MIQYNSQNKVVKMKQEIQKTNISIFPLKISSNVPYKNYDFKRLA